VPAALPGGVAQQCLGEVHQVLVVPVRRVELHHRELGVVAHADAFVAKAAVDLEHALEAADDQALQVQLGRDAQEHLLVQRVVVRHEGLGVGAAGDGVEHGRFHLHEAVFAHEAWRIADSVALRAAKRARAASSMIRST
jgi:ribosomal protein L7/L12